MVGPGGRWPDYVVIPAAAGARLPPEVGGRSFLRLLASFRAGNILVAGLWPSASRSSHHSGQYRDSGTGSISGDPEVCLCQDSALTREDQTG